MGALCPLSASLRISRDDLNAAFEHLARLEILLDQREVSERKVEQAPMGYWVDFTKATTRFQPHLVWVFGRLSHLRMVFA